MSLEGRIDIDLHRCDDRIEAVVIRSSRPQLAQKLFAGRRPDLAVQLAGSVFSLCGKAQGLAARLACDAALGHSSPANLRGVLIELGLEHSWRLLLNWPQQAGHPPDMEGLQRLRKTPADDFAKQLDSLLSERLLGLPAADWLHLDLAGFDGWRGAGSTPMARMFDQLDDSPARPSRAAGHPESTPRWLPTLAEWRSQDITALAHEALVNPAFCAQPTWHGQPAETGALCRQREHPLIHAWLARQRRGSSARLLARLVELALLPAQLRSDSIPVAHAWPLAPGLGAAGVETSRGLLLHVVHMEAGVISDYRIVAPTEWNFHPQGPLSSLLLDLPADARLAERARQAVLAVDPCVDYGLEILDA